MRYAIVIEKAEGNYSAYAPDLPGCIATGATVEEVKSQIREAIVESKVSYSFDTPVLDLRAWQRATDDSRSAGVSGNKCQKV